LDLLMMHELSDLEVWYRFIIDLLVFLVESIQ
jgi:hypothetical protein